jgi:high-affinity iron transporter
LTTRRLTIALFTGLLALFAVRATPVSAHDAHPLSRGELITFGSQTCAARWQAPNPGRAHFRLRNLSDREATVYLFQAESGHIVGSFRKLKPGRTRAVTAKLKGGNPYEWACDLKGYPVHDSDAELVALQGTPGGPGPQGIPIQAYELYAPLSSYRAYADKLLKTLATQLGALRQAVVGQSLTSAQADWLSAHLTWLELGQDDGAYGAFGKLGREIDGTSAGYVGGTANPQFTGFHRIELDLWSAGEPDRTAADVAKLQSLVAMLTAAKVVSDTSHTKANLTSFVTRVHEVLEDADRDTLTGEDDYGSGTGIASITADVTATREFLTLLAPLLAPRSPGLVGKARSQLTKLLKDADSTRSDGNWVAVAALPVSERELIDADTGELLETLSPIPDLLRLSNT